MIVCKLVYVKCLRLTAFSFYFLLLPSHHPGLASRHCRPISTTQKHHTRPHPKLTPTRHCHDAQTVWGVPRQPSRIPVARHRWSISLLELGHPSTTITHWISSILIIRSNPSPSTASIYTLYSRNDTNERWVVLWRVIFYLYHVTTLTHFICCFLHPNH